MEQISFHQSVRGYNHVVNDIVCEDASDSLSDEEKRYHIAIIADGHGSKECFRSEKGSQLIVEVTKECLQEFAKAKLETEAIEKRFYKDIFSNGQYSKRAIKDLTDTIIDKWHERVEENYKNNPTTEKEKELIQGKSENNIYHIYGTTLIAALRLPQCLLILQQGDGRCVVFHKDGEIEQPVPWDEKCEDNITTSMCDQDVKSRIRNHIINLDKDEIIACYLGSDGVEDAYRDTYENMGGTHTLMGGVNTFYKDLSCNIIDLGLLQNTSRFKDMLTEFSKQGLYSPSGSGDDVSVAGIVNIKGLKDHIEQFKIDVEHYALEEKLFIKKNKLQSMRRKHDILCNRMNEYKSGLDDLKKNLLKIEEKEKQKEIEEQTINNDLVIKSEVEIPRFPDVEYNKNLSCNELNQNEKIEVLSCLSNRASICETEKNIKRTENRYNEAKKKYEDYHEIYQNLINEIKEINRKINDLSR